MRYYLDTEFIEDGKTIDLISIGIVAEDGREYYAVNQDCDYSKASSWVWDNVLKPMGYDTSLLSRFPLCTPYNILEYSGLSDIAKEGEKYLSPTHMIAEDIKNFMHGSQPEIWAEWCSYDWVAFCQLFGTMMDLPDGFPMRCRDVVQYCENHLGLSTNDWPASLETEGNHNALMGARTVKARWEWCSYMEKKLTEIKRVSTK